jgi:anti-sigma regulatory factor (Ser/Thr protein kinase)
MDSAPHTSFVVEDNLGYLSLIKRDIHRIAGSVDFSPSVLGETDIIVSEMVSNLLKHTRGKGGEILVKKIGSADNPGIEILSIDSADGMSDTGKMLIDGASTTNTLGQGLGAIRRLSHEFGIYSQKGWGTILLSRVFKTRPSVSAPPGRVQAGMLMVSKPGEQCCGDGYSVRSSSTHLKVLCVDGLGHGKEANYASAKALEAFHASCEVSPVELIREVHQSTRKTRGVVGCAGVLDYRSGKWSVCGVGNISSRIYSPTCSKPFISYNGILGLSIPGTLNSQLYDAEKNQLLIMCSDGIRSRWDIQRHHPGIFKYDPVLIAAVIYKDHARKNDDMLTAVVKVKSNAL